MKYVGNIAVAVVGESRKFSGHPVYRTHCAVIFAIAQLSCSVSLEIFGLAWDLPRCATDVPSCVVPASMIPIDLTFCRVYWAVKCVMFGIHQQ